MQFGRDERYIEWNFLGRVFGRLGRIKFASFGKGRINEGKWRIIRRVLLILTADLARHFYLFPLYLPNSSTYIATYVRRAYNQKSMLVYEKLPKLFAVNTRKLDILHSNTFTYTYVRFIANGRNISTRYRHEAESKFKKPFNSTYRKEGEKYSKRFFIVFICTHE